MQLTCTQVLGFVDKILGEILGVRKEGFGKGFRESGRFVVFLMRFCSLVRLFRSIIGVIA